MVFQISRNRAICESLLVIPKSPAAAPRTLSVFPHIFTTAYREKHSLGNTRPSTNKAMTAPVSGAMLSAFQWRDENYYRCLKAPAKTTKINKKHHK